jgi:hypothetical protein
MSIPRFAMINWGPYTRAREPVYFLTGRCVRTSQDEGAYSSQGKGRAEIVVEPKPEMPFEIVRGSQGGAADRGASRTGWVD